MVRRGISPPKDKAVIIISNTKVCGLGIITHEEIVIGQQYSLSYVKRRLQAARVTVRDCRPFHVGRRGLESLAAGIILVQLWD